MDEAQHSAAGGNVRPFSLTDEGLPEAGLPAAEHLSDAGPFLASSTDLRESDYHPTSTPEQHVQNIPEQQQQQQQQQQQRVLQESFAGKCTWCFIINGNLV